MVEIFRYKNTEIVYDRNRYMVMEKHPHTVYVAAKDFFIDSPGFTNLVKIAWEKPEKITKYFGKHSYIIVYNGNIVKRKINNNYAPVKLINGLELFIVGSTATYVIPQYFRPEEDYIIYYDTKKMIKTEKIIFTIEDAPKERFTDREYIKQILNKLKKLQEKYRLSFIRGNGLIYPHADFIVYFNSPKVHTLSPILIKGNEARVKMPRTDGLAWHITKIENLENIFEEPERIDFEIRFPVNIPNVVHISTHMDYLVRYTLSNGTEIILNMKNKRQVTIDTGMKKYSYHLKNLDKALKLAGVIE